MLKSKLKPSVLLTSLLLASCGGDDKNENKIPDPVVQEISVTAIDGYLRKAQAYYDVNGNGSFDPGEPDVLTGEGGKAVVTVTGMDLDLSAVSININAIEGTVDESTIDSENPDGIPLTSDQYFELRTLPGAGVASPLTTYAAIHAEISGDLDASKALVAKQFNVDVEALSSDFIANDDKATAVVAELIIKTRLLPGFIEEAKNAADLKLQLSLIHSLSLLANEMSADELAIFKESLETVAVNGQKHLSNLRLDVESELSELSYDELNIIAGVISAAEMESVLNVEMTTNESEAAQLSLQNQYALGAGVATLAESLKENLSVISATTVFDLTLQLMNHAAEQAQERHDVPLTAEQYQELNLFVLNVVGMDVIASVESEQTSDAIFDELSSGLSAVLDGVAEMLGSDINDLDGDGILNIEDTDIDGDGVANEDDAFVYDKNESVDVDGDGIGDNADRLISEHFSVAYRDQSQVLDGPQTLARVKNEILIPNKDGLYVVEIEKFDDPKADYQVLFADKFTELDIEAFYHAETLPNGQVLMFGRVNDDYKDYAISVLLENNDDVWEIANIQKDLKVEDILTEEHSNSSQWFNFEVFQFSPSGDYIYAVLTEFNNSFVVAYKLNEYNNLEYVNSINVSDAGYANYEKNFTISESGDYLYFGAGSSYSQEKESILAIISVDQESGAVYWEKSQSFGTYENMQVFSLANDRVGILKGGRLMLLEVQQDKRLKEISAIGIDTSNELYAAVSGDKTQVAFTVKNETAPAILTYDVTSTGYVETGTAPLDDQAWSAVWSENGDAVYTVGFESGSINAFTPSSGELLTKNIGLPYIHNSAQIYVEQNSLRVFIGGEIYQELSLNDGNVDYVNRSEELLFEGALNQYFYSPQFTSDGSLFSRVRVRQEPDSPLISYVGLWTVNDDNSLNEFEAILESSRESIYYYKAWLVSDEYFITFSYDYIQYGYAISLFEMTSKTTAVEKNSLSNLSFDPYYAELVMTGLNSFELAGDHYRIHEGLLEYNSTESRHSRKAIALNDNKVRVSLESDSGIEIGTYVEETLEVKFKTKFATTQAVALEKWNDNAFVTLDVINESLINITLYSVDVSGNHSILASGSFNGSVDVDDLKVLPMPEINQIWLITFNEDNEIFVLDVNIDD